MSTENPIPDGRAIVSVPLDGKLAPAATVRSGDLVQVVRATGASGGTDKAEVLGTAYVLEVTEPETDELGGNTDGLDREPAGARRGGALGDRRRQRR